MSIGSEPTNEGSRGVDYKRNLDRILEQSPGVQSPLRQAINKWSGNIFDPKVLHFVRERGIQTFLDDNDNSLRVSQGAAGLLDEKVEAAVRERRNLFPQEIEEVKQVFVQAAESRAAGPEVYRYEKSELLEMANNAEVLADIAIKLKRSLPRERPIKLEVSKPVSVADLTQESAKKPTKKTLDVLPLEGEEKRELIETLQEAVVLTLQIVLKLSEDKQVRDIREYYEPAYKQIERTKLNSARLTEDEIALLQRNFLVEAIKKSDAPYGVKTKMVDSYNSDVGDQLDKVAKSPITNWINKRRNIGPKDQYMSSERLGLFNKVVIGIFRGPSDADPVSFDIKRSGFLSPEQRRQGDLSAFSTSGLPDRMKSKEELTAEGLKREYYHDISIATPNVLAKYPDLAKKAKEISDHLLALVNKHI